MAPRLDAPTLVGRVVRLEPLSMSHVDDLVVASDADRSTFDWTLVPHGEPAVRAHAKVLLDLAAAGEWMPFAQVRVADGRAVGMTNYLAFRWEADADHPFAVEVGGTWLAHSAQRSGINVEAKLLLLTHTFDVWGVRRLDLKTDARNARSRAAIEGIGARLEGVLRSWQPSHAKGEAGLLRDTAMFSIVVADWPDVRSPLVELTDRFRGA